MRPIISEPAPLLVHALIHEASNSAAIELLQADLMLCPHEIDRHKDTSRKYLLFAPPTLCSFALGKSCSTASNRIGGTETLRMHIGIAADHGAFALKASLQDSMRAAGHQVVDFGAHSLNPQDDYPDFIVPLARAVAAGDVERGIALCGSGIGASIAANKVPGVRAGLIHDVFSAHQGVEDDDMNVFCLGGKVIGTSLAWELAQTFLVSRFSGAERFRRRLAKIKALEVR